MTIQLIELTQIRVTAGKVSEGFKKMIALNHIITVEPCAQNTALITLTTGEKIIVKETYNDLKARFAMPAPNLKNTEFAVVEPLAAAE